MSGADSTRAWRYSLAALALVVIVVCVVSELVQAATS